MVTEPEAEFKGIYDCPVIAITNLIGDIYLMRLSCPPIASQARPGQFVNIKVSEDYSPFLRKPFSISQRSVEHGWFEVLWKVVGKGTAVMAAARAGDVFSVLGPLGQGFHVPLTTELAIVVGGGLGVAPLPFLYEVLRKQELAVEVFLGARTLQELSLIEVFEEPDTPVTLTTDDGSAGQKGLVTEPLMARLRKIASKKATHLFSCGPTAFLNSMINITTSFDIEGQISIETMMGCGFGICVGCPVRVRAPMPGEKLYRLTCVDGPVFDAREVSLHD